MLNKIDMKNNKIYYAITLLVTLTLATSVWAAWAEPTDVAPEGNAEAPINVSAATQTKLGHLGTMGMLQGVSGILAGPLTVGETALPNGLLSRVKGNFGADKYCDSNGLNCQTITELGVGGLPTGTANQTLRHNGTGWVASNALLNNDVNVGIGVAPLFRLHVQDAANGPTGFFQNTNGAGGYAAAVEGSSVNAENASGAIGYLGGHDPASGLWYGVKGENATAGHAAIMGNASNGAYAGYFDGGAVKIGATKIQGGSAGQLWVANDVCIDGGAYNGKCLSTVGTAPPGSVGTLSCQEVVGNTISSAAGYIDMAAYANCPAGWTLTGGGFVTNGPACGVYVSSRSDSDTWQANCKLLDQATLGDPLTIYATATCCKVQ